MEEKRSKGEYVSVAGLKARGWTATLITTVLQDPDLLVDNPHYKSAAPMRLYLRTRIEACEQQADWQERTAVTRQRQEAAAKALLTKRKTLEAYLAQMTITVQYYPPDELTQRACEHYNRRRQTRALEREDWDWAPATPDSDARFLERISVNFLRHACSRYETELRQVFGKVGVEDAYQTINQRVYEAIAQTYPYLATECARQQQEKAARGR